MSDVAFETRVEIVWRVVGGTMSTSAVRRSYNVSSWESSDDTEERDADEDVRDEEEDAYGEDPESC